jgi:hypothetical protein
MAKQLTELQAKFLDAYFGESKGRVRHAMEVAGYAPTTSPNAILDALAEEIKERTKKAISYSGAKAVFLLEDVIDGTELLGVKEKIAAAKDILDRAGFTKTDKIEVQASSPLFILPEKRNQDEDDD